MSETKHTPGPWRKTEEGYIAGEGFVPIRTPFRADAFKDGPGRSDHSEETLQANAAFIVRAVNAHDALVDALGTLVASLSWEEKRSGTTYHGYEMAKAALAKAEGK